MSADIFKSLGDTNIFKFVFLSHFFIFLLLKKKSRGQGSEETYINGGLARQPGVEVRQIDCERQSNTVRQG